jgi:hypothetical protein
MYRRAFLPLLSGLAVLVSGCATKSAIFPDRTPEQVWTALVTVCEQPEYEKWVLVENNVWVDANFDRVEVQRRLKRDFHRHGSPTIREDETYEMQFVLERTEPPVVTGTIRNSVVRTKGLSALDHIFDEMHDVLSPESADDVTTAAPPSDGG